MRYVLLAFALAGTAACSGGGLTPPSSLNLVNTPVGAANFDVDYNSGLDIYTVEINGDTDFLPGDPALDLNTFDRASNPVTGTGLYVSTGNHSTVSLLQTEGATNLTAAQYQRLTDGAVGQIESATYTGEYIGFLTNTVDDSLSFIADGNVELTIDLANVSVNGSISNRLLRDKDAIAPLLGPDLADIVLETSTIDSDGQFSGTATGGELEGFMTDMGSYVGLIAGPNSDEAVGVVRVRHFGVATLQETGIIAVGH